MHTDVGEVLRGHASLSDGEARAAFLHTLQDDRRLRGQRVDASDRLYLAQAIPFLLVWGERDPIIPVEHARAAHRLVPRKPARDLPDAGHFPHLDDPLRFVRLLTDFIETTEPARVDAGRWSELLRSGGAASPPRRARAATAGGRRGERATVRGDDARSRWPRSSGPSSGG